MPAFIKNIEDQIKTAMKAKASLRLQTLRLIKTALKNRAIELKTEDVEDTEAIRILSTMVKQRKESMAQYTQGGREDLANKEKDEITIIQEFLPQALSSEELESIVKKAISDSGASGMKAMGQVMKLVTPQTQGRADGQTVSTLVKQLLS